jgi:hypothetical protein
VSGYKVVGRAERRRRAISLAFKRLMAVFAVHVLTAFPELFLEDMEAVLVVR